MHVLSSHEDKVSTMKENKLSKLFGNGHFVKQCKSSYKCKVRQQPQHPAMKSV